MSRKIEYKSVLSFYIERFVALKEAVGYNTRGIKYKLLEIDSFKSSKRFIMRSIHSRKVSLSNSSILNPPAFEFEIVP